MKIQLLALLGLLGLTGCSSSKTTVASFYTYETECLGVELDGSQTLRVWGSGKNKKDAVEQAKKNAVHDVLFKGVRQGKSECNMKPLMIEVNAEEKYADYFQRFLRDGGEYRKYTSSEDEKTSSKISQTNQVSTKYGVTVRVLRSELKERLKSDGIIK